MTDLEHEHFELTGDDRGAVKIAMNVARRLLRNPRTSPIQIIGLGNALYALERLPIPTPGAFTQFGIAYREGTDDFHGMRYIQFCISESEFGISCGGSVYDKSVGSGSFSGPEWRIELGGYRDTACELYTFEESINEYLNLGGDVNVSDESDIEYE